MKKIVLFCLVSVFLVKGYAQDDSANDNVDEGKNISSNIKLNLVPLAWGEFRLGYEKVVKENQAVQFNFGYLIPRGVPSVFYDPSDVNNYGGTIDLKNRITGLSLSGEYRFYTSSKKNAPKGFYVAPFIKWNKYSAETSVGVEYEATPQEFANLTSEQQLTATLNSSGNYDIDVTALFNANVRQFGAGVMIGCQWAIGNKVTIDWNFIGLGVDSYLFGIDITSPDVSVDLTRFGEDIEREVEDFDLVGSKIDVTVESDKIRAEAPFILPNLRTSLSIGFAF